MEHDYTERAAIYAYYADPQTTRERLNAQVEQCKMYCQEKRLTIVGVYEESGGVRLQRDSLFEEAKNGKFQAVVVSELSRFSRNLAEQSALIEKLKTLGISVKSTLEEEDNPLFKAVRHIQEM